MLFIVPYGCPSEFTLLCFLLQKEEKVQSERTSAGFCVRTWSCALGYFLDCDGTNTRGQKLLSGRNFTVELQKILLMDLKCGITGDLFSLGEGGFLASPEGVCGLKCPH